MQKQPTLSRSFVYVAIAVLALLAIPFTAMQFNTGVLWSAADFLLMGLLLMAAGTAFVLATRMASRLAYRLAALAAVGTTFFLVYANLAVGLIGGGPHIGNLMYIGVVGVVLAGTYFSNFTSRGLGHTMLAAAGSLVMVAAIALWAGMQHYPGSSVVEIIGVNGFFAGLYMCAALLFRFDILRQNSNQP